MELMEQSLKGLTSHIYQFSPFISNSHLLGVITLNEFYSSDISISFCFYSSCFYITS